MTIADINSLLSIEAALNTAIACLPEPEYIEIRRSIRKSKKAIAEALSFALASNE